jgi:adenylosuccinate lyase
LQANRDEYVSPLATRYAPEAMRRNFSDLNKFRTWRRLWVALAESQKELGLPITGEQLDELRRHVDDVDFEAAARFEKELRHDVMAHIHAYAAQCPKAAGIIHLGATSAFVTDNTDVILMHLAAELIRAQLGSAMSKLSAFARKYAGLPALGYTHLQPAQPVTVGKRAVLWLQDLLMDLRQLDFAVSQLKLRGVKGATGTQASALLLFEGDESKVRKLSVLVAQKLGFNEDFPVTSQTYPRKADYYVLAALSGIAQSAAKFATDIRLLSGFGEISEPHGKSQVGSSAMPQKANPMRSERICALARFVINHAQNAAFTAAEQWLERTLDDSANRRLVIPETFMAVSAVLNIYVDIVGGLVVKEEVIKRRLGEHLPFLASEAILMAAVRLGGNRQELHEKLRSHALAARARVESGKPNDFLLRVRKDPAFASIEGEIESMADAGSLTGLCSTQVEDFLRNDVDPILSGMDGVDEVSEDLKV